MPGHRILVWYDDPDDPVWHERVLLWPSREVGAGDSTRWLILTPGDDLYWEEMNCGAGHDVTKVSQLGKKGERPYLDDPIYSFAEPLDEGALLGHVRQPLTSLLLRPSRRNRRFSGLSSFRIGMGS